ncbi:MAG: hypothetical protein EOO77_35340, partial [Oxalobacteraceae bacterium]
MIETNIRVEAILAKQLAIFGKLSPQTFVRRTVHPLRPAAPHLTFEMFDFLGQPCVMADQATAIDQTVTASALPPVILGDKVLGRPFAARANGIGLLPMQAGVSPYKVDCHLAGVRFDSAGCGHVERHPHHAIKSRANHRAADR